LPIFKPKNAQEACAALEVSEGNQVPHHVIQT